jgi:hypothetical protein
MADEDYSDEGEKKKPKSNSFISSIIGIIAIIGIIVFIYFSWQSFTIMKTIIFAGSFLLILMIAGAMGLNKGMAAAVAVAISIGLILFLPASILAAPITLGNTGVSLKNTIGETFCIIKNPADSAKCTSGETKASTQINMNFPENLYSAGAPLNLSEDLSVIMPDENAMTITPQCYLGNKLSGTKIDAKIMNAASHTFKKKASEQTASIKCSSATSPESGTGYGTTLTIDLLRTSSTILKTTILTGTAEQAGSGEKVVFTSDPASSVLPYSVEVSLDGNQPFAAGVYEFQIFMKKQSDFSFVSLDSINITSMIPVTCQDFKQRENNKSTIYLENVDLLGMKSYERAKDSYAFDCKLSIIYDTKETPEEKAKSNTMQISLGYTTSKEFTTVLSPK